MAFCPNCGEKVQEDYKICPKCGRKLEEKNQQEVQNANNNKKSNKPAIIVVSIAVIIMILVLLFVNLGNTKTEEKQQEEKPCITFLNEGSEYKEICVNNGEIIEQPESPVKEGYEFSHWATHQKTIDGSEKYDFSKPVTESTTVFAHYNYIKTPDNTPSVNKYEQIYNEYANRLRNECPNLSITECAEISNEGVEKMAEYMYSASGKNGQYATYEEWAKKLYDVYIQEAR